MHTRHLTRRKYMPQNENASPAPRIRALLVGINKFPNLDKMHWLRGCIQDTQNVCDLLTYQYKADAADIRLLHDERATRAAVLERLTSLVASTCSGEIAVFHISTHGALITRRSPSGTVNDHASEILCLSDISPSLSDPNTYISDSDLNAILTKLKPGALFVALIDACHAGALDIDKDLDSTNKSRCLCPPPDIQHRDEARQSRYGLDKRHRLFERAAINAPGHVLVLTACGPKQTSADAFFPDDGAGGQGRYEGAFTHFLCAVLKERTDCTYQALLDELRQKLAADGEQQVPEFMPAAFASTRVLMPLVQAEKVPQASPPLVPRHTRLYTGRDMREVPLASAREAVPEQLTADPRYWNLRAQLASNGFSVAYSAPESVSGTALDDTLAVDTPVGYAALILEYRDGLAIWTRPAAKEAARARGVAADTADAVTPKPGTVRHYFSLRTTRSRGLGEAITGIIHVITHPIEAITHAVVQELEKRIFDEGLYLLQGASFSTDDKNKNPAAFIAPPDPTTPRALLFIHGVLSSIEGCFGKDVMNNILTALSSRYILLGYNHLSATRSVADIARDLDSRLRQCLAEGTQLNVVAHSQGGVIARQLGQVRAINKLITFGSPHQGTHLANSLDKFVTILGALPLPPGAMEVLFLVLKCMDNDGVIPGFLDMRVDSPCIAALNNEKNVRTSFYCYTSAFTPGSDDNAMKRLLEDADTTLLFQGRNNDLVIDTACMVPPDGFHIAEVETFGAASHVMHTDYFRQSNSAQFILTSLS
jgi:pimeloyl-ACP methyl ester carboxylesterase